MTFVSLLPGHAPYITNVLCTMTARRETAEVQPFSFFNLGTRWGWAVNATTQPFTPEMTRYLLHRKLGRPGPVWTRAENLEPPGFDPRTVQPVAIPAHRNKYSVGKM
jgi:hypothetical protein